MANIQANPTLANLAPEQESLPACAQNIEPESLPPRLAGAVLKVTRFFYNIPERAGLVVKDEVMPENTAVVRRPGKLAVGMTTLLAGATAFSAAACGVAAAKAPAGGDACQIAYDPRYYGQYPDYNPEVIGAAFAGSDTALVEASPGSGTDVREKVGFRSRGTGGAGILVVDQKSGKSYVTRFDSWVVPDSSGEYIVHVPAGQNDQIVMGVSFGGENGMVPMRGELTSSTRYTVGSTDAKELAASEAGVIGRANGPTRCEITIEEVQPYTPQQSGGGEVNPALGGANPGQVEGGVDEPEPQPTQPVDVVLPDPGYGSRRQWSAA